jgi:hypothetical protein
MFAKRDGKEAVNSFSKVFATEAPGITLNSREVFRIDPLLPIEGPESSSILDIRLLEWMFDKLILMIFLTSFCWGGIYRQELPSMKVELLPH